MKFSSSFIFQFKFAQHSDSNRKEWAQPWLALFLVIKADIISIVRINIAHCVPVLIVFAAARRVDNIYRSKFFTLRIHIKSLLVNCIARITLQAILQYRDDY